MRDQVNPAPAERLHQTISMGNHQAARAARLHLFAKKALNGGRGFLVEGAGGFIQQDDGGLQQRRADEADPLPLTFG